MKRLYAPLVCFWIAFAAGLSPAEAQQLPVPVPMVAPAPPGTPPNSLLDPTSRGNRIRQGLRERLDRRRATVNGWSRNSDQQLRFSIAVGLLGLVVGLMQGVDKKWIRGLTVVVGFSVSAITLFTDRVYPADYRTLQRSVAQATPILEDLEDILNRFDVSQTPENQTAAESEFKAKSGQIDLIGHKLLGLDQSPAPPVKSGQALFGLDVVHAQSSPSLKPPTWTQPDQQSDSAFRYFVAQSENGSLTEAKRVSLDGAIEKAAAWLQGIPPNSKVQPTPQLMTIVRQLAEQSDTWYTYDSNRKAYRYFTRVRLTNEFQPRDLSTLDPQALLGSGLGPFRLGMPPKDVSALLPRPFATTAWNDLPVATEFRTAEVRYFWVYTKEFMPPNASRSPFGSLSAFQPCWEGQSYVTFLFTKNGLNRISVRFFWDCPNQVRLAETFANTFQLPIFGENGFRKVLQSTTAEVRLGRNATAIEIFKTGSPQPDISFWDSLLNLKS